jgi:2',3'-cyclic-nucleotide 2'-phosphodiesterase (5'-nucleotidase family)
VGRENTVFINAGDNFGEKSAEERKKARLMFKSFSLMGLDVMGPGQNDFVFGLFFPKGLSMDHSFPLVCANLFDDNRTIPYYASHVLLKKGGKRVLITSALDPSFIKTPGNRGKITDPVSAIRSVQQKVPHDIFIAILHTSLANAKLWLNQIDGVDLAVLGHKKGVMYQREMINNALLVYNNFRGSVVSYVDISISEKDDALSMGSPRGISVSTEMIQEDDTIRKLIKDFNKWVWKRKHRKKPIKKYAS